MVEKHLLKNGLRLLSAPMSGIRAVTVLVLVGAGSRYETKDINGISHFLEHLFFKGAKKYRNTKEVSEAIDSVGGDFNAFTGKEYAGYYVRLAGENLDLALDVLSDMLINPNFDPAEIDKERGVILEELNMYQDTPMYQIGWEFEKLIFGDQPLGRDQIGTKELIRSVTQEQFRDYFAKLYTPDNTVIAVAGNFEKELMVEKIERFFPFKEAEKQLSFDDFANWGESKLFIQNKATEQAHLTLGFPAFADFSEQHYAQKLLSIILGGNMSSRLFLRVREAKGLAYDISTSVDVFHDVGVFSVYAGVTVEKIEEALEAIIAEFDLVAKEGVTEAELQKAKAYWKGKLVLRMEDSESIAHLAAKNELLHGRIVEQEEIYQKIEQVELAQVNKLAGEIFQSAKRRLAIIGPYAETERFTKYVSH